MNLAETTRSGPNGAMRYTFADCELDTERHCLLRGGVPVVIEPQVFDLIRLLVENPNRVVSRDEIIAGVWLGRIVSDSAISARIAVARKALGDDGKRQTVIRTVPRRGPQMATDVTSDAPQPASPALRGTLRIRYTRSDTGKSLAYAVTGQGPPALLVGSLMSDIEQEWHVPALRPLFDAIGARHSLLRCDPSGAGQSDSDIDRVDFDAMADELRAAADAAGFARVALFSMTGGTLPAMHFAARYPERVARFAIVCGYVDGRSRRAATGEADALRAIMAEGWSQPESSFVKAYVLAYFPQASAETLKDLTNLVHSARSKPSMLLLRDASNQVSLAPLLPLVKCPTLIVHGRHDGFHPLSEARKMAAGIENAELVVLETANNLPLPENPVWERYIETLLDFFAG